MDKKEISADDLEDIIEYATHRHEVDLRLKEESGDIDTCCLCRLDIRHPIHKKGVK